MNQNFYLLLAGQLVSQVGDKFHMIAIAFWVLKTTGSSAQMGAVLAASLVPSLLLGFISGAVIDRFNRKFIIVGTDMFRGIIIGLFAVLFYLGEINLTVILIMQVLLSVNAAFFDPAIPAIIPTIVAKEDLAAANSYHQFINGFSTIAGAFLGGILVSMAGYLAVFVLNAVSFMLSALFEGFIRIPQGNGSESGDGFRVRALFRDMKAGYRYLLSNSNFILLLIMVMVIHFFVGSIEVMMPVIAQEIAGESGGARVLGFLQSAFGAGTVGVALLIGILTRFKAGKATLFGAVFCIGVVYMGGAMVNPETTGAFWLFVCLLFLLGGSIICAGISFRTMLQMGIDNDFAGRVFAVAGSLGNGSIPLAMISYGMLMEVMPYRLLLMVSGMLLLPLSLYSYMKYRG